MKIVRNPRTEADVNLLLKVFSDLLPDGREILHEQVEAVLGNARASARYRTVTNRWRRTLMHERGIVLDGRAAEGRGFVSLTPDEMIRFTNRGVRAIGRKIRRLIAVAAVPQDEQLSDAMRLYRQRLAAAMSQIAGTHKAALRDVSKSLAPMKQLPRATGTDGK